MDPGYFAINGIRYETSLVVLADRLADWALARFEDSTRRRSPNWRGYRSKSAAGHRSRSSVPSPALTQALHDARIGLEVMDTQAACRTYNILLAEDRRVGAAILIDAAA